MTQSRLIHPKMTKVLEKDFFPQRCALKKPVKSQSTTGKEKVSYFTQPGYEALPCRVAPASGGERRGNNFTHLDTTHAIMVPGSYDDVTEEWVAEVDGVTYQILKPGKASRDPEGAMTHFDTRFVR